MWVFDCPRVISRNLKLGGVAGKDKCLGDASMHEEQFTLKSIKTENNCTGGRGCRLLIGGVFTSPIGVCENITGLYSLTGGKCP